MKTSELIKKLKRFGKVRKTTELIEVWSANECKIATVLLNELLSVNTCYVEFSNLNLQQQTTLFRIICDYGTTPLNEREDEPKFHVHLWNATSGYLNESLGGLTLDSIDERDDFKTMFTKPEYEVLGKNYPEFKQFLPPFDENDPRFEMVKDGESDED